MNPEPALQGKVILVTGGGRGVGRAVALDAAAAGAKVVVNDFGSTPTGAGGSDGSVAHSVAAEIVAAGGEAVADTGSVAQWQDALAMVKAAVDRFGRIDGVVNNAGILNMSPFEETDPADFERMTRVHLFGTFNVSRAAAPYFRAQHRGVFVHVTSSAGLIGMHSNASYCGVKGGIVALAKAIALDMEQYGVRSNCIAPSADSRLSKLNDDQVSSGQAGNAPKPMLSASQKAPPEDVAPLFTFLLSDLSVNVNGQIFGIRGRDMYLYSQPRVIRMVQNAQRWTIDGVAEKLAALRGGFTPLESINDVFTWKPF
jgi:NAD(P)-dependent dehydrogenase (short-subunit alcohol dehydrogenase family)